MTLKYSISHDIVTNWDDAEEIWHHFFYNELNISPQKHPFLLTQDPVNPKAYSECLKRIMVETFNVLAMADDPGLFFSVRSETHDAIVMDFGDGVDVPVVMQRKARMILQKTLEAAKVVDVSVVLQRQVPTIRKVLNEVDVLQLRSIDKVVDVPVVKREMWSMILLKTVEISQIHTFSSSLTCQLCCNAKFPPINCAEYGGSATGCSIPLILW